MGHLQTLQLPNIAKKCCRRNARGLEASEWKAMISTSVCWTSAFYSTSPPAHILYARVSTRSLFELDVISKCVWHDPSKFQLNRPDPQGRVHVEISKGTLPQRPHGKNWEIQLRAIMRICFVPQRFSSIRRIPRAVNQFENCTEHTLQRLWEKWKKIYS